MSENKKQNSTNVVKPTKKYKKYIKFITYIILILVLFFIFITVYIRVKSFIDGYSVGLEETIENKIDNEIHTSSKKIDAINSSELEQIIKNQKEFQYDIYQKFDELNKKLTALEANPGKYNNESRAYVEKDNKSYNALNKKESSTDLNIIFNLINALNTNKPFLTELEAFYNVVLVDKKSPELEALYEVSITGIPTSYDLLMAFEALQANIKREIYSDGNSWISKLKYYLSFFIVVQKECSLSCSDNTLDSKLSKIKYMLMDNRPEYALKIAEENNLSQLRVLSKWYIDLNYRVKANILSLKLKQYFLSS